MESPFMFDGTPPTQENLGDAARKHLHDMRRVPRDFVVSASSARPSRKHAPDDQIGVVLDERSFESLQRIARYLDIEGASECTRAELLAKIREALSW